MWRNLIILGMFTFVVACGEKSGVRSIRTGPGEFSVQNPKIPEDPSALNINFQTTIDTEGLLGFYLSMSLRDYFVPGTNQKKWSDILGNQFTVHFLDPQNSSEIRAYNLSLQKIIENDQPIDSFQIVGQTDRLTSQQAQQIHGSKIKVTSTEVTSESELPRMPNSLLNLLERFDRYEDRIIDNCRSNGGNNNVTTGITWINTPSVGHVDLLFFKDSQDSKPALPAISTPDDGHWQWEGPNSSSATLFTVFFSPEDLNYANSHPDEWIFAPAFFELYRKQPPGILKLRKNGATLDLSISAQTFESMWLNLGFLGSCNL